MNDNPYGYNLMTQNGKDMPYGSVTPVPAGTGLVNGGHQTGEPAAYSGGRRRRSRSRRAGKKAKRSRRSTLKGGILVGMAPPMGGRRSRSHKSKKGGALYEFGSGPYVPNGNELADGVVRVPPLPLEAVPQPLKGGKRRNTRKASPWLEHVMSIKNKKGNEKMSLGEAMKKAKETYKK